MKQYHHLIPARDKVMLARMPRYKRKCAIVGIRMLKKSGPECFVRIATKQGGALLGARFVGKCSRKHPIELLLPFTPQLTKWLFPITGYASVKATVQLIIKK